jgi:hypothetical protein
MYSISLQSSIDDPWRMMKPIAVGPVPTGGPTPGGYVVVTRDGEPFARIDLYYGDGPGPFMDVVPWRGFVVVGMDSAAHLVDPMTREVRSIACDFYFGGLYPFDDRLLIASASELICLDPEGGQVWRRDNLGIDGVVVNDVSAGIVTGEGEWDPPGGWRPFRLSLATGEPV